MSVSENHSNKHPLILASASPRRHAILRELGVPFEIHLAYCDEICYQNDPVATVGINACHKAEDVRKRHPHNPIIAADTVVAFGGRVLGKPHSYEEARDWLISYAGQSQTVYTAVAMWMPHEKEPHLRIEASSLIFRNYDASTAEQYIALVQPFDRAGAYDINTHGEMLISRRIGSYSNVMGLPGGLIRDWLKANHLLHNTPQNTPKKHP